MAIKKAKDFAEQHNVSLSKLTEFIYLRLGNKKYDTHDEMPISEWVNMVADGEIKYDSKTSALSN